MKDKFWLFALAASLLLIGCAKKAVVMTPLGDAAPSMGTPKLTDMKSFAIGTWCVIDPMSGSQPNHRYTFTANGKFETGDGRDWTCRGEWNLSGDLINLRYEKMNDKSFDDFRDEYKKAEEGGTQIAVARALEFDSVYDQLAKMGNLWLDDDQKHLSFSDPKGAPAGQDANAEMLNDLARMSKVQLELMQAKSG